MIATKPAPASAALSISNLKFRYPGADRSSPWVVDVTRLELVPGEQMLLTGGSGSGKSTLLHLIAGLIDPDEGLISVNSQSVRDLAGPARDTFRGRSIGMIFQTFNLLQGFTAVENVMAALMFSATPPGEHDKRARDLLKELGVERPDAEASQLSVGQQQRVAVARAVATGPALVLADEPTASLDPENAAAAMDLIQKACRTHNAALVCVSHDPAMVERFERRASLASLRSGQR